MDTVRICKEDQELIFKMLAAILWLGNITFQVTNNENHIEVVDDEGKMHRVCSIPFDRLLIPSDILCPLLWYH